MVNGKLHTEISKIIVLEAIRVLQIFAGEFCTMQPFLEKGIYSLTFNLSFLICIPVHNATSSVSPSLCNLSHS